jgi:hypothetical protein
MQCNNKPMQTGGADEISYRNIGTWRVLDTEVSKGTRTKKNNMGRGN